MTLLLTPTGERTEEKTYANTPQARDQLVRDTPEGTPVVLETGTYGKPIARCFQRAGFKVVLADVRKLRHRAGTAKKTDPQDAFELAQQYRLGVIKQAYLPTDQEEELRCLVRHRMNLGRRSTFVKNQIHAQLGRAGVPEPEGDALWTARGLRWLVQAPLTTMERVALDFRLRELELLGRETREINAHLAELGRNDKRVRRLMTIRGLDYYSALVLVAEIGDIHRFPTAKKLAAYAGIVPRVHQSGQTSYTGHITRHGPSAIRWILAGCATAAIKAEGKMKRIYRRISRRSGPRRAKVAVAHKLLTIVWAV